MGEVVEVVVVEFELNCFYDRKSSNRNQIRTNVNWGGKRFRIRKKKTKTKKSSSKKIQSTKTMSLNSPLFLMTPPH